VKRRFSNIILVLIFLVGLSILLYPTVSNYINQKNQSRVVAAYNDTVSNMTEEDYSSYFEKAHAYNEALSTTTDVFYNADTVGDYENTLNLGSGIMGYITIKKLGVELPIYHGTDDEVLEIAAGHLEGSSFPVGGESTHAVISAHRGLPSAKLFTDLDKMEVGDTFTITVLNEVLTYEVDNISIVLPTEVDQLQIEEGKDLCTLMTCTPYGINTHRLLVRGHRVDTVENTNIHVTAEAFRIDSFIVASVIAVPMLLILLIWMLVRTRKKKKTRGKKNEADEK
jgi:sortase A